VRLLFELTAAKRSIIEENPAEGHHGKAVPDGSIEWQQVSSLSISELSGPESVLWGNYLYVIGVGRAFCPILTPDQTRYGGHTLMSMEHLLAGRKPNHFPKRLSGHEAVVRIVVFTEGPATALNEDGAVDRSPVF
jgi:hypothetical protein